MFHNLKKIRNKIHLFQNLNDFLPIIGCGTIKNTIYIVYFYQEIETKMYVNFGQNNYVANNIFWGIWVSDLGKFAILIQQRYMCEKMEDLFLLSRTIIQNPIYQKIQHVRFANHKKAVDKFRNTSSSFDLSGQGSNNYLRNLQKFKNANKSISRIFDEQRIQNQSLYRRLLDIDQKKERASSDKIPASVYHAENWLYRKSQQQKRIDKENEMIQRKIDEQKKNKLTVNKLKKQFKKHDRLVNHAQKLKNI